MSLRDIFLSIVFVTFFLNINTVLAQDSPAEPSDIKHLEVTDISLSSAAFSWVTDEKTSSNWVEVSSSDPDTLMIFYDDYKQRSYVHFVRATDLLPDREYNYRVGSGNAVWDNEGALYSFKTLPSSYTTVPSTIIGNVTDTWDNPLERVLVRVRIKKEGEEPSMPRTLLTDGNGNWVTTWSDFYAQDGSLYYSGSGDKVLIHCIPNYWSEHSDSSAVLSGGSPQNLGSVDVFVYDPHEVVKGDLDNNGAINIFDLLDLLRILSGKLVPDNQQLFGAADVDTSGKINIFDLLAFLALLKR